MVTVTTYAELQAAVMRDEPVIRLEAHAKQYYERKSSDVLGGGVVGAGVGDDVAVDLAVVVLRQDGLDEVADDRLLVVGRDHEGIGEKIPAAGFGYLPCFHTAHLRLSRGSGFLSAWWLSSA